MKIKNKGFTLIELLAVIVILAIIAVIAVPIVLDLIDDTKESSSVRSGEFYLNAVDNAIMQYKLKNNKKYTPSQCLIDEEGNLLCDDLTVKIEVDVDGEKPDGGTIFFKKGKITSSELTYGTKTLRTDEEGNLANVESSATLSKYNVVYFDVATGKSCKESSYDISNSKTGYNGIDNKTGNQNSCLKFYVLNEVGTNVNLLLDHNTTAMVAWNSSGVNTSGPNEVLSQLKLDTQNWNGTITPANYSVGGYTVNYTGYKARLITVDDVVSITGHTTWTETAQNSFYFFATKTTKQSETCKEGNTSGCVYGWLYDRTTTNCTTFGCLNTPDVGSNGYWTSAAVTNTYVRTCYVYYKGSIAYGWPYADLSVRPVIEIPKF